MVEGLLIGDDLLKAKVKGERAGAEVAGMRYVGYEVGVTERSVHVLGKHCRADIADEDFRYVVVPLDAVTSLKMVDHTDHGQTIELQTAKEDVVLQSEKQSTLSKNLERLFMLMCRLLA
ncbi:hypothetical protein [Halopelagius fulvigenes]|uniref:Uncharacterized protein n=1 Tax=Halopelagius fulvigenes TaxID=1198324 RepID=A0ABD5U4U6_9EURY